MLAKQVKTGAIVVHNGAPVVINKVSGQHSVSARCRNALRICCQEHRDKTKDRHQIERNRQLGRSGTFKLVKSS